MPAGVPHQLHRHPHGDGRRPGLQDHEDPQGSPSPQGHVKNAGHEGKYLLGRVKMLRTFIITYQIQCKYALNFGEE